MVGPGPAIDPSSWRHLDALLDAALDRTGAAREAFLAAQPAADAAALRDLLKHADCDGPVEEMLALTRAEVEPVIGTWRVGPQIGAGGMSSVYAVRHVDPAVDLRGAMKLLRAGPGTTRFVERFQQERDILVGLRHPHIVGVFDGGTTAAGIPYYVMERIDGPDWGAWCAANPLAERVRRLVQICRAVAYAHQRLIVHCDLKPANLLFDRDGEPRVLDFGIAKLLDVGEHTITGQRMLTPRWSAPEQVNGAAVTTRTDVHALGLLLWSTITGKVPREALSGPALLADVGARALPLPSTLAPVARGDLDAIVQRATALDPADRYRGAAELADDLDRYLRGEAVLARARARWYTFSRWLRSHVRGVLAAALTLALALGWALSTAAQNAQIAAERDAARQAAVRAKASQELLVRLLESADPANARGEALTAREVLEASVRELEVGAVEPALRGELLTVIGRVQLAVGDPEAARASLEEARALALASFGPSDRRTLEASLQLARTPHPGGERAGLVRLAALLPALTRPRDADLRAAALLQIAELHGDLKEFAECRARAEEAAARFDALGDVRHGARARAVQGYAAQRLGDPRGRELLLEALADLEALFGTRVHPEIADMLHELAMMSAPEESIAITREVVAIRRTLGGGAWATAVALNNLGLALEATRPEESLSALREAVQIASDDLGADHPKVERLRMNLGAVALGAGAQEEGARLLRQTMSNERARPETRERARVYLDELAAADAEPAAPAERAP
ncbi:MAG: serine/threonine-protein kinase [Nannocystaceae bacterium]